MVKAHQESPLSLLRKEKCTKFAARRVDAFNLIKY